MIMSYHKSLKEMSKATEKIVCNILGGSLLLVAINAFGGGYYGMSGAEGMPAEWLKGSPFSSYFIPSLILFVGIGGWALFAAIVVFRKIKFARTAAFISGVMILVWLSVQIFMIGYVSWMQQVTAVAAILILFLTWLLPTNKVNVA